MSKGTKKKTKKKMDFPGSIVVKTLHFQCRGHRFDPRSGHQDPACHMVWPKTFLNYLKKKKKEASECCVEDRLHNESG